MNAWQNEKHKKAERGAALIEFAIAFPVFLAAVFFIFDFSMLSASRYALNKAAEGAVSAAAVNQDLQVMSQAESEQERYLEAIDKVKSEATSFATKTLLPQLSKDSAGLFGYLQHEADQEPNSFVSVTVPPLDKGLSPSPYIRFPYTVSIKGRFRGLTPFFRGADGKGIVISGSATAYAEVRPATPVPRVFNCLGDNYWSPDNTKTNIEDFRKCPCPPPFVEIEGACSCPHSWIAEGSSCACPQSPTATAPTWTYKWNYCRFRFEADAVRCCPASLPACPGQQKRVWNGTACVCQCPGQVAGSCNGTQVPALSTWSESSQSCTCSKGGGWQLG